MVAPKPSLPVPPVAVPSPAISAPPAGVPTDAISDLLSSLSGAVATQTGLIPGLLGQISDLLTGQPGVPTPAITSRPGAGVPSPGIPDLLAQLSSLFASAGVPMPTGSGVAVPSVPAQGIPSRSGVSGAPGFLTSVIPAVSGFPAGSGQPAISVPTEAAEPAASVFNPRSPDNVAVNYGQPETVEKRTLSETCADPNVDIVILGFVTNVVFGGGIYPRLQLVCLPLPPFSNPP